MASVQRDQIVNARRFVDKDLTRTRQVDLSEYFGLGSSKFVRCG